MNSVVIIFFRLSQLELKNQVENLSVELNTISKNQQCPIDLESYIKKLLDARRRITTINSLLQNAQVSQLNRNKSSMFYSNFLSIRTV